MHQSPSRTHLGKAALIAGCDLQQSGMQCIKMRCNPVKSANFSLIGSP